MKIRLVGTELFHLDRRADMTGLIAAFRNSSKTPKNPLHVSSRLIGGTGKFLDASNNISSESQHDSSHVQNVA